MKKILLILIVLFANTVNAQSWKYFRGECVVAIGTSHFLGDLGGADAIGSNGFEGFRDIDFQLTRPSFALGYRYYLSPKFAVKGDLTYARLNGDDALTTELPRNNRNLHFRSPAIDVSAKIEFYPFNEYFGHPYRNTKIRGSRVRKISPYIFVGIGGFWFNPKAKYKDEWVALRPLMTEGVEYKRIAFSLPFGGGIKYAISNKLSIGLEFCLRYTSTDYIDDVSTVYVDKTNASEMEQYLSNPTTGDIPVELVSDIGFKRGDPTNKDSYLLTMISFNYKILKGRRKLPKY